MHTFGKPFLPLLCLLLVLVGSATVLAQSSAGSNLGWRVMGSGGGTSASAGYRVQGTVGQSLAGPPNLGSATFGGASGYWVVGASTPTSTVTPTAIPTATSTPVNTAVPTTTPAMTPGPPHRSFLPNITR